MQVTHEGKHRVPIRMTSTDRRLVQAALDSLRCGMSDDWKATARWNITSLTISAYNHRMVVGRGTLWCLVAKIMNRAMQTGNTPLAVAALTAMLENCTVEP